MFDRRRGAAKGLIPAVTGREGLRIFPDNRETDLTVPGTCSTKAEVGATLGNRTPRVTETDRSGNEYPCSGGQVGNRYEEEWPVDGPWGFRDRHGEEARNWISREVLVFGYLAKRRGLWCGRFHAYDRSERLAPNATFGAVFPDTRNTAVAVTDPECTTGPLLRRWPKLGIFWPSYRVMFIPVEPGTENCAGITPTCSVYEHSRLPV